MFVPPWVILAALPRAHAYETDQFSRRTEPLADASPVASAKVDEILDKAILWVNRHTGCEADNGVLRRSLSRRIHRLTSARRLVLGRGLFSSFGYTRYTAWLETGPVDRITLSRPESLYANVTLRDSFILRSTGVCSTLRIGDVRLGTDKFFHFFDEGYGYFERSGWGEDDSRAARWGMKRENSLTGLETSSTFSFADLMADWAGYTFYRNLLEEQSVVTRDPGGCLRRSRNFDWKDWVSDEMDEFINPNVYTGRVRNRVVQHLGSEKTSICEALAGLSTEQRQLRSTAWFSYIADGAPQRDDVFVLAGGCPESPTPLVPVPVVGPVPVGEGAAVPLIAVPVPADTPPDPTGDGVRKPGTTSGRFRHNPRP